MESFLWGFESCLLHIRALRFVADSLKMLLFYIDQPVYWHRLLNYCCCLLLLIDWLIDWLIGRLVGWLVGWLDWIGLDWIGLVLVLVLVLVWFGLVWIGTFLSYSVQSVILWSCRAISPKWKRRMGKDRIDKTGKKKLIKTAHLYCTFSNHSRPMPCP